MKSNERLIQFFDLDIYGKTRSAGFANKLTACDDIQEIMQDIIEIKAKGKAKKDIGGKPKMALQLEDIQEMDECWVILINAVDVGAAHPVTQKLGGSKDDRVIISLAQDVGLESSSHLIIEKGKNTAKNHLAIYEKSSAIPFAKAVVFLNHLLRLCYNEFPDKYRILHPSGEDDKWIRVYPYIEYFGHPSDEFIEELDSGILNSIKLTTGIESVNGYDANQHQDLIGVDVKMSVSRARIMMNGGNWRHVKEAVKHADTINAPFVRIGFTDNTSAGRNATINTDTGLLSEKEKYVKKCKITGFNAPLTTAVDSIHEGIRDKMLELIT